MDTPTNTQDVAVRKLDYAMTVVGATVAFGLISLTGIWQTLPSSIGWWLAPALVLALPVATAWVVTARGGMAQGKRLKVGLVSHLVCATFAIVCAIAAAVL